MMQITLMFDSLLEMNVFCQQYVSRVEQAPAAAPAPAAAAAPAPKAAGKKAAAEKPAAEPAKPAAATVAVVPATADAPAVTVDTVRTALMDVRAKVDEKTMMGILAEHNATTVKQLPESSYAAVVKSALTALGDRA
jgi:hypothetical protein